MKKNSNSLLFTILGGVITCFVCVGMVLIYSKGETKKFNNTNSFTPIAENYVEEEIALGDSDGCTAWNYTCPNGGSLTGTQCTVDTQQAGVGPDNCSGSWTNGVCHIITKYAATKVSCKSCSSEYTLSGGSCVISSCPAGQGADSSATTGCSNCAAGTYSPDGDGVCHRCPTGTISPVGSDSESDCVATKCPAGQGKDVSASSGCSNCAAGTYSGNNDDECHRCPTGTTSPVGSDSESDCVATKCPAGQGKDVSASSGCSNCAAGTYSGNNDDDCHKCPANTTSPVGAKSAAECVSTCETGYYWDQGITGCKPCPEGTISPKGASNVSQCLKECTGITIQGECAMRSDCEWNNNSCGPKSLDIVVNGGGIAYVTPNTCKSFTFTVSYKSGGAMYSASSISWSEPGCSGKSCTVKVCGKGCEEVPAKKVTATVSGKSATGTVKIVSYKEWSDTNWNKEPAAKVCSGYACIYNTTALDKDVCIAYSEPYTENGVTKYKKQWNRCCGGGGSTPSEPTTPLVPYCYLDSEGEYHWATESQPGWKKMDTITKYENCQKTENPACYLDLNGKYLWGKYANKDGYTLITAIVDKNSCKEPTSEYACYKNTSGDYRWSDKEIEGYTKVESIKTPVACSPKESPACYLHGSDFIWGSYSKVNGYIYVGNITTKDNCKKPETDACYKDSKGNYVWGKYGNDNKYTLIPSVSEESQCKAEVPVPKTASDVSKLVYVFMAILMTCGIGFIYYSNVVRKNNQ